MSTPAVSFTGHETFPLRFAWLAKAVEAVERYPEVFTTEEAIAEFGVGRNMVRAIRHWGLATGVLEPVPGERSALRATPLGRFLFHLEGADPYCEDPATLWLLHWLLCRSPERATLWHFVFGHWRGGGLDLRALQPVLSEWLEQRGAEAPSDATLKRDLLCLINSYAPPRSLRADPEDAASCPLGSLDLLQEAGGTFYLREGRQRDLPVEVFAFAVLDYWEALAPGVDTLALQEALFASGSPGRIFLLGESQAFEFIEAIGRWEQPPFGYDETAGLRQLYRQHDQEPLVVLARHYGEVATGAP